MMSCEPVASEGTLNSRVTVLVPAAIVRVRSFAPSYDQQHEPLGSIPAPSEACQEVGLNTVYESTSRLFGAATSGETSTDRSVGWVGVGLGVLVIVGVLLGVGVFVGVPVIVGVPVAVGVLVMVGVLVNVFAGVLVRVGVLVMVGVLVGVLVEVPVGVRVGVLVIVGVLVRVGVRVGVLVEVGVVVASVTDRILARLFASYSLPELKLHSSHMAS
jgi:hypothetical protein